MTRERLEALAADLAPDLSGRFRALAQPGEPSRRTRCWRSRGARPWTSYCDRRGPVVYLEAPRHLGNLGAAIRVAAAANAAAVLTSGDSDPWHPDAIRGAAGLQFALPVARVEELPPTDRPLVAIDPDGDEQPIPPNAILAFGSERHGLSEALLEAADARIRIPMRAGVSSLNLATSVAAVLYGLMRRG